ncbi:MAG: hypothetical protein ABSE48_19365 [Verrucomicrobiota bacterium]|jgi:hypothetical protein
MAFLKATWLESKHFDDMLEASPAPGIRRAFYMLQDSKLSLLNSPCYDAKNMPPGSQFAEVQ